MQTKTRYHLNNVYLEDPLRFGEISLVQVGRRYCEPTEVIHPHSHRNWYELTLVTGGAATVLTGGEPYAVSAGDIYLSFPCDLHEIRADRGTHLDYDFFAFSVAEGELSTELAELATRHRTPKSRVFRDETVQSLVNLIIAEFTVRGQIHTEQMLTDLLRLSVNYLLRDFTSTAERSATVSEAEILCFRVMSYIDTHIYSIGSLQEIAPHFGYHYRSLSRLFKRTTGKTISEYHRHRTLETAKALILERKRKIGEIAELFGYSLYSFSKAFKEKYGVSPKAMQKEQA